MNRDTNARLGCLIIVLITILLWVLIFALFNKYLGPWTS